MKRSLREGMVALLSSPGRRSALVWIAGGILLAAFALMAYSQSLHLRPAWEGDEACYFDESCWIAENCGAAGFVGASLCGEYPYDNRNPLIQWAAGPWARRSLDAVRPMRTVKVLMAVAGLALVFWLLMRCVPAARALLLVALLALTQNWAAKSGIFVVEPVNYALVFLAWAFIAGVLRPRSRWLWAGMATGLVYLSKGTGILLLLALLLALLICAVRLVRAGQRLWESERLRRFGLTVLWFAAGFVLTAGVLLTRNVARYGNPFHNSNSRVFWMDKCVENQLLPDQYEPDRFTFLGYWRHHTVGDAIERVVYGVKHQTKRLFGVFAADRSFGRPVRWATGITSVAVVFLGVVGILRERKSWLGTYTAMLVGLGYLLFVWYSYITVSSRFLAMFAPIVGAVAFSSGTQWFGERVKSVTRRLWFVAPVAVVVAVVLLLARVDFARLTLPRGEPRTNREYRFLLDWFQREAVDRGAVCFSTPGLWPRYDLFWLLPPGTPALRVPPFGCFEELDAYIARKGGRFLVVERDSLKARLDAFKGYFEHDPDGNLVMRRVPPGWRVVRSDRCSSSDFVILERNGQE